MSWAEINHNKGMAYGAMPLSALLEKMEVTDPALLPERPNTRPGAGFSGYEVKDHMISELLDRTPDAGYLEADRPRRNPQMAREVLNLRYNGTRGSESEPAKHPELFLGFTGNDPRGAGNDPRFENMRKQMAHRARHLEKTMGTSVGHDGGFGEAPHQEAERPWTGPALQQARVALHKDARKRLKIFTTSKDNWAAGGAGGDATANAVRSQKACGKTRAAVAAAGDEQWADSPAAGHRADARSFAEQSREGFSNSRDSRSVSRALSLAATAEATADMPVAVHGRASRGRTKATGAEAARAARTADRQQQVLGRTRGGRSVAGMKAMARAMAAPAQSRRTAAARAPANADGTFGAAADGAGSEKMSGRGHARLHAEADVARAYYQTATDQAPGTQHNGRSATSGQVGLWALETGRSGAAQQATWRSQQNHLLAALAANMAQTGRTAGQHAADGGDRIKAAHAALAAGARPAPAADTTAERTAAHALGRSVRPGDLGAQAGGYDVAKQAAVAAVHASAAARGLEVANYSALTRVEGPNFSRTNLGAHAAAAGGQQVALAAAAHHLQNALQSQKLPEYRGQTQVSSKVESRDRAFEHPGAARAAHAPAVRMGLKTARYDRVANAAGDPSFYAESTALNEGGEFDSERVSSLVV